MWIGGSLYLYVTILEGTYEKSLDRIFQMPNRFVIKGKNNRLNHRKLNNNKNTSYEKPEYDHRV